MANSRDSECSLFSGSDLVPLYGAKSKAWLYFGFKVDERGRVVDKKAVICRICCGCFPFCGNTTNLLYHLRTCHKEEHDQICTSKSASVGSQSGSQTTLPSYVANSKQYNRGSARFQQCEESLLNLVCKEMLPVSTVESQSLRSFVDVLDPRYKPSSHTHFSRVLIPQKYETVKQKLVQLLSGSLLFNIRCMDRLS